MRMPQAYTPSAPNGVGTDDYRCFLLDPHLARDSFLTGTNVLPGNPDVVHHVILFRVDPGPGRRGRGEGRRGARRGLDLLRGHRASRATSRTSTTPTGWAPGRRAPGESLAPPGYGVPLERGSRIVMQVHYNLLVADDPDTSAAQLRLAPRRADADPAATPT